jgi:protein FRA10AC1
VPAQFALRWRTEAEVLSGAGENTCGNTRCKHHENQDAAVHLNTLELPFAYEEHGKHKSALVKVVLCPRCLKKLMWKRNQEKAAGQPATSLDESVERGDGEGVEDMRRLRPSKERLDDKRESMTAEPGPSTRRRTSRSRSPRHRNDKHRSRRRRSPSP